jgi:hypothetical protein
MSFFKPAYLLSLALLTGVPDSKFQIPKDTNNSFQYKLSYDGPGSFMDDDNAGSATWFYRERNGTIESNFDIKVNHSGIASAMKAHRVRVRSKTKFGSGKLENYISEDFDSRGNSKNGINIRRNSDGGIDSKCREKSRNIDCPSSVKNADVPDLYTILAVSAYVNDLNGEVAKNVWHDVYYKGRQGKVRLKKSSGSDMETFAYEVEGFSNIMKIPGLSMKVWLRKKYPHFMEKSEIKVPLLGKVIVKK